MTIWKQLGDISNYFEMSSAFFRKNFPEYFNRDLVQHIKLDVAEY